MTETVFDVTKHMTAPTEETALNVRVPGLVLPATE